MDPHTPGPLKHLDPSQTYRNIGHSGTLCGVFPTVHRCSPLCTGVPNCALILPTVRYNSPLCGDATQCARVVLTVRGVPQCVQMFPSVQGRAPVCRGVPLCVGVFPSERGIPQCVGVFPKVQGYSMEHPPNIEEHPCTVGNTCTHWGTPAHTVEHLTQLITPLLTVEHPRTVGNKSEQLGT